MNDKIISYFKFIFKNDSMLYYILLTMLILKLKVSLISIQGGILQIRRKLGPCSGNILAGKCSVLLGLVK